MDTESLDDEDQLGYRITREILLELLAEAVSDEPDEVRLISRRRVKCVPVVLELRDKGGGEP